MVIKVINISKCIDKFAKLENITTEKALKNITEDVKKDAKSFAPVLTGQLKRSIKSEVDKVNQVGRVFTNTEYAIYQEFGTRFMRGQPFMRPALMINQLKILATVKGVLLGDIISKIRG